MDDETRDEILRRGAPLLSTAVVATVVLVMAGLVIVHPLDPVVAAWDRDVMDGVLGARTPTRDDWAERLTWIAETVPVLVLTALAVLVARWRTSGWTASVFLLVAVAGEKLMYLLVSVTVGRDRPDVPTVGTTYATRSFPSGHVGTAVALYGGVLALVLWRRGAAGRAVVVVLTATLAVVVGACRVYAGFHFPTDVMAGVALGTVSLVACWRALVTTSATEEVAGQDTLGAGL